jgi:hypothetical protein
MFGNIKTLQNTRHKLTFQYLTVNHYLYGFTNLYPPKGTYVFLKSDLK